MFSTLGISKPRKHECPRAKLHMKMLHSRWLQRMEFPNGRSGKGAVLYADDNSHPSPRKGLSSRRSSRVVKRSKENMDRSEKKVRRAVRRRSSPEDS